MLEKALVGTKQYFALLAGLGFLIALGALGITNSSPPV